jgi:Ca2+-binding RTX toxin-like protein
MTQFMFDSITASEAMAFNGAADSVQFGSGDATQVSVAYLSAPEQVAVSFNGMTVDFGTGVYGSHNLTFANGGMVFIGGGGADAATGGGGSNALFGGGGDDTLTGGGGANLIQGNQGNDSLAGGAQNNTIYGGQGDDAISLGSGFSEASFANGNRGSDTITAAGGTDTVLGGQGDDLLNGGNGGDFLNGNLGNDTIHGGTGNDTILGEGGRDVMSGGGGADLFIFNAGDSDVTATGADQILDWSHQDHIQLPVKGGFMGYAPPPGMDPYGGGGGMTLDFPTALNGANAAFQANPTVHIYAAQVGNDVDIFVDTNGDHMADMAITLVGASLSSLDASNYV